MIKIETLAQILSTYLQGHFDKVEIDEMQRTHKNDGSAFRINADGEAYTVIISDDAFADDTPSEDIIQSLGQYNLANVMSDLSGFAVTVTDSGCIFEN